jgi:predicted TIM-barrel fold metal-dependent hydrolase
VVSSDCHAGATLDTYRAYLPGSLHEPFDDWRAGHVTQWADLRDTESPEYRRNFDSGVRQADLEAEGIAAEVLFPNTIPPFAPQAGLHGPEPDVADAEELGHRWEGIRAHNRWLADFCAEVPGRRAGVAQILLHDPDRAVEELRWVAEQRFLPGVLIPNPSPGRALPQLHAPMYEPVWSECEALGLTVHTHGGGGVPDYGDFPTSAVMMYLEFGWYAFRPLVRLVMSGVFERHPDLQFAMTEVGWMPELLPQLDYMARQIGTATSGAVERRFGSSIDTLSLLPSEYWERQCHLGASVMNPYTCKQRHRIGLGTMMWGADYPHSEGTFPHTRPALRHVFADVPSDEVADIVGLNALRLYGLDLDALRLVADRIGPTVAEVATPLGDADRPSGTTSMAFAR